MLRICKENPVYPIPNKQTEEGKAYVRKKCEKRETDGVNVTVFSPYVEGWNSPSQARRLDQNQKKK